MFTDDQQGEPGTHDGPRLTTREYQALLRYDLSAFIEKAFYELMPGRLYLHNWHIDAMAAKFVDVMEGRIKRLVITLPPRYLKSHCAVAFAAWLLGRFPGRRIIGVSYANELASQHSNAFRQIVRSEWYRALFPHMRIDPRKDKETEVRTTRGGCRIATTIGGSLTGRGGNLVIIDDPIKAADAESETTRTNVNDWFDGTLSTRLDDKRTDAIIIIMQRLHVDDLVGHVLEKGGWDHLDLPAIAEEVETFDLGHGRSFTRQVGMLLHEEREPLHVLDQLKRDMGTAAFSAQYQQRPVPAGGNMIKLDWFSRYSIAPPKTGSAQIIQSWDTALKEGELNDYSVCITALVSRESVYILHVFRKRMDYPDLKKAAIRLKREWNANLVLIEDKGSGISLLQDMKYEGCYAKAVKPMAEKAVRMSTTSPRIESGAVHIPMEAPWLGDFLAELLAFPKGKHDDQVDALSQLLAHRPGYLNYTKETLGV